MPKYGMFQGDCLSSFQYFGTESCPQPGYVHLKKSVVAVLLPSHCTPVRDGAPQTGY